MSFFLRIVLLIFAKAPPGTSNQQWSDEVAASSVVQATLGANSTRRGLPLLGFGNELSWQRANDSELAAVVSAAGSAAARYPGGVAADFWDWRAGCACTCPFAGCWDPTNVRVPPPVWARYLNASNWTVPGADVGVFAAALRAKTIFDLNVVQGNASWQVEGLESFHHLGVPVELVELGHEVWDPLQNQKTWANGTGYLAAMQPYISAVSSRFPKAQIALAGMSAGDAANAEWNRAVLSHPESKGAHAATLDFYTVLDIDPTKALQPSQAAVIFAKAFDTVAKQAAHADETIPTSMRIWITEFGHRGPNSTWSMPSFDGTWLEGLYSGTVLLLLLRTERIDVALPYCLTCPDRNAPAFTRGGTGLPPPISFPGSSWKLTARGHVFREIFTTARTALYQQPNAVTPVTMQQLDFNPNVPLVATTADRINTSSLIGWAFLRDYVTTAAVIMHLGPNATTVDLSAAVPKTGSDNWRLTITWSRDADALVRNSTAVGALRQEFSLLAESRVLLVPPFALVTLVALPGQASLAQFPWKSDDESSAVILDGPTVWPWLLDYCHYLAVVAVLILCMMSVRQSGQMQRQMALLQANQEKMQLAQTSGAVTTGNITAGGAPPTTPSAALRRRVARGTPTIDASDVSYECAFQTNFKYAVTRSVEDKFQKEAISILDFGAIPNGVTDCTAAMQHAIDFVTTSEDDQVESGFARPLLIPPGTYVFSQVNWRGSLHIIGAGGILKMNAGNVGSIFGSPPQEWWHGEPAAVNSSTVVFDNVILDGSCAPKAAWEALHLPNYSDSHFATDDPTSSWRAGFMIGMDEFATVEFHRCRFINFARGVCTNACGTAIMRDCNSDCVASWGQVLFVPERCDRVVFCGNTCLGTDYSSFFLQTGQRGAAAVSVILPRGANDIVIANNNLRGHQLVVQSGDISKVQNSRCVVTGNVIDYPPADTAVYGYNSVVCTGNISRRSGDVGFSFDESRYVTCCANVVEGANTAGITIFNAEGCIVNDNTVQDVGQMYDDAYITEHYPPSQFSSEILIGIRIAGLTEGTSEVVMKECVISGNTLRQTKELWWTSKTGASPAAVVVGYGNLHNTLMASTSQTVVVQGNVATVDPVLFPDFSITVAECTCAVDLSTTRGRFRRGEVIAGQSSKARARFVGFASSDLAGNGSLPVMFFAQPVATFAAGEVVVGTGGGSVQLGKPLKAVWTGAILADNVDLHTQRGGQTIGVDALAARF